MVTDIGEQALNTITVSTLEFARACILAYIAATNATIYILYAFILLHSNPSTEFRPQRSLYINIATALVII